jgi:hypothetical protein
MKRNTFSSQIHSEIGAQEDELSFEPSLFEPQSPVAAKRDFQSGD